MRGQFSFSDIFSDIFSDTVPEKDKGETAIAHMKIRSDSGLPTDRIYFFEPASEHFNIFAFV